MSFLSPIEPGRFSIDLKGCGDSFPSIPQVGRRSCCSTLYSIASYLQVRRLDLGGYLSR